MLGPKLRQPTGPAVISPSRRRRGPMIRRRKRSGQVGAVDAGHRQRDGPALGRVDRQPGRRRAAAGSADDQGRREQDAARAGNSGTGSSSRTGAAGPNTHSGGALLATQPGRAGNTSSMSTPMSSSAAAPRAQRREQHLPTRAGPDPARPGPRPGEPRPARTGRAPATTATAAAMAATAIATRTRAIRGRHGRLVQTDHGVGHGGQRPRPRIRWPERPSGHCGPLRSQHDETDQSANPIAVPTSDETGHRIGPAGTVQRGLPVQRADHRRRLTRRRTRTPPCARWTRTGRTPDRSRYGC